MNKKILIAVVIVALIVITAVVFIAFNPLKPQESTEPPEVEIWSVTRIYDNATRLRIIATVKNHESYRVEVELKFTTKWDNEIQDTAYKTFTINGKDTQNQYAILEAQNIYIGDTEYDCEIVSAKKS